MYDHGLPGGTNSNNSSRKRSFYSFPLGSVIDSAKISAANNTSTAYEWKMADNIFTANSIKWAVDAFEPYKTPCADGIFPVLPRKRGKIILDSLRNIFRTSYTLNYIPKGGGKSTLLTNLKYI